MKKYLIVLAAPFFFACNMGEDKQTALADSLKNVNTNIKNELMDKETLLNTKEDALAEFVTSFNEIQRNLNEIKDKEKIITSAKDKELNKSNKDRIITDIQAIYDLLDKNKQKVASLNKKLKGSNMEIESLELAINNLTSQSVDKEIEISELKFKLENLNVDFSNLKTRYEAEVMASDLKTQKLNTAYYAVGSKKDLTDMGLITKEGGFIGLGKVVELNNTLDKTCFTKIDITKTTEITIHGDKVKLISTHPEDSYQLVEGSASIDKIIILDPVKFWSVSKYLIITSEKHKKSEDRKK